MTKTLTNWCGGTRRFRIPENKFMSGIQTLSTDHRLEESYIDPINSGCVIVVFRVGENGNDTIEDVSSVQEIVDKCRPT